MHVFKHASGTDGRLLFPNSIMWPVTRELSGSNCIEKIELFPSFRQAAY